MKPKSKLLIFICICVLSSGCGRESSESITADELAEVLQIKICEIQIPAGFRSSNERFYVKKERNGGYRDLWDAFQAPESGLTVKAFINTKTNQVRFLADGKAIGGFHANPEGLLRSGGWNTGSVDYTGYRIIFGDSTEGLDLAKSYPKLITYHDPDQQKKADESKWVRYTLVAGSDIENPPAYIIQALESDRQRKSE